MSFAKHLWRVGLFGLLAMGLFLVPQLAKPAKAATVTIDHFDETLSVIQTGVGTNTGSNAAATSALGGVRDIQSIVTSGTGKNDSNSNATVAGRFTASFDSSTFGSTLVQWDGTSGITSPPAMGLGNVDLTGGGTNAGIIVIYTFNDFSVPLTVRYWESASNCSEYTTQTPGGVSSSNIPRVLLIPWSSFTNVCAGASNLADNTKVNAVEMFTDMTGIDGVDLTLDLVEAGSLEYGDNPDSYGTTESASGPGHYTPSTGTVYMGSLVDRELDGQPTVNSFGDDSHGVDDEDGYAYVSGTWTPGNTVSFSITVSANACLNGWIDYNNNGSYAETTGATGEKIINNVAVTAGVNNFTKTIPAGAANPGYYYARFRLTPRHGASGVTCTDTILSKDTATFPAGEAIHYYNGEDEDYKLSNGQPTALDLVSFTGKAQDTQVVLKWETATELQTLGFNVWRKQGKQWVKQNDATIAAQNTGQVTGAKYSFTDSKVKAGKAYHYKLEVLNADGTSSQTRALTVRVSK